MSLQTQVLSLGKELGGGEAETQKVLNNYEQGLTYTGMPTECPDDWMCDDWILWGEN